MTEAIGVCLVVGVCYLRFIKRFFRYRGSGLLVLDLELRELICCDFDRENTRGRDVLNSLQVNTGETLKTPLRIGIG